MKDRSIEGKIYLGPRPGIYTRTGLSLRSGGRWLGSRTYFLMESSEPIEADFMPGRNTRACPLATAIVLSKDSVAGGACRGACEGIAGRGKTRADSSRNCWEPAGLFCAAIPVSSLMTSWRSCFQGISDGLSRRCDGLGAALDTPGGGTPLPLPRASDPRLGAGPWPLGTPRVSCMKKLPRLGMKAGSALRFCLYS